MISRYTMSYELCLNNFDRLKWCHFVPLQSVRVNNIDEIYYFMHLIPIHKFINKIGQSSMGLIFNTDIKN